MVKKIKQFISFWYQRYLLATELYMVEPWERMVIHVLYVVLFAFFFYMNYNVIVWGTTKGINMSTVTYRSKPTD